MSDIRPDSRFAEFLQGSESVPRGTSQGLNVQRLAKWAVAAGIGLFAVISMVSPTDFMSDAEKKAKVFEDYKASITQTIEASHQNVLDEALRLQASSMTDGESPGKQLCYDTFQVRHMSSTVKLVHPTNVDFVRMTVKDKQSLDEMNAKLAAENAEDIKLGLTDKEYEPRPCVTRDVAEARMKAMNDQIIEATRIFVEKYGATHIEKKRDSTPSPGLG